MGVAIINRQRRLRLDRQMLRQFGLSVLKALSLPDLEVSIVFVSDRRMRLLNRNYRGKDKTTDVLSFSYAEDRVLQLGSLPVLGLVAGDYLGDVVISVEMAARDAEQLGLTFDDEVKRLIIHGMLHLCGYDHEVDDGEMLRLEQKLRRRLLGRGVRATQRVAAKRDGN